MFFFIYVYISASDFARVQLGESWTGEKYLQHVFCDRVNKILTSFKNAFSSNTIYSEGVLDDG